MNDDDSFVKITTTRENKSLGPAPACQPFFSPCIHGFYPEKILNSFCRLLSSSFLFENKKNSSVVRSSHAFSASLLGFREVSADVSLMLFLGTFQPKAFFERLEFPFWIFYTSSTSLQNGLFCCKLVRICVCVHGIHPNRAVSFPPHTPISLGVFQQSTRNTHTSTNGGRRRSPRRPENEM